MVMAQQREKNNGTRRSWWRLLIWLEWWKHSQPSSGGRPTRSSSFVKNLRRLFAELESPASASPSLRDQFIHGRLLPQSSICTLTELRPAENSRSLPSNKCRLWIASGIALTVLAVGATPTKGLAQTG